MGATGAQPASVISRVGNTGRATNDHLHLELAISPTDSIGAIVDSLQRFPPYTTNPELWLQPLPGTGIVAGQVFDSAGAPVPQARIYGIAQAGPDRDAVLVHRDLRRQGALRIRSTASTSPWATCPPGTYMMGTEIAGRKVLRRVTGRGGQGHVGRVPALMYIELTDHLRCPADHEESFWCCCPIGWRIARCGPASSVVRCAAAASRSVDGVLDVGGRARAARCRPGPGAGCAHRAGGLGGPGGYLVWSARRAGTWRELAERNPGVGWCW